MNLVTLKEVKHHVSVDTHFDDEMLEEKRRQASAIVLDYLKIDTNDTGFNWLDAFGEPTKNVPQLVRAATLLIVGSLFENRDGSGTSNPLSQSVIDMLARSRTPTLA